MSPFKRKYVRDLSPLYCVILAMVSCELFRQGMAVGARTETGGYDNYFFHAP